MEARTQYVLSNSTAVHTKVLRDSSGLCSFAPDPSAMEEQILCLMEAGLHIANDISRLVVSIVADTNRSWPVPVLDSRSVARS